MIIRMNWNVYLIIMYCTCYDFPPSVNHASKCHVQWHFSASNPNNITSQLEPVLRVRRDTVNLSSPKCLHIIARVPTSGTATIPFNSKGPSHGQHYQLRHHGIEVWSTSVVASPTCRISAQPNRSSRKRTN